MTPYTISDDYLKLQQELHLNPSFGVASLQFSSLVARLVKQTNVQSICDYGAGKKLLLDPAGLLNVLLKGFVKFIGLTNLVELPLYYCGKDDCCISVVRLK